MSHFMGECLQHMASLLLAPSPKRDIKIVERLF